MKIYLLACCLLLCSSLSYANQTPENKFFLMEKATDHKLNAIKALAEADKMSYYIPDLENREHMHNIIIGFTTSFATSDPKVKLLSIGLALLGSLASIVMTSTLSIRTC